MIPALLTDSVTSDLDRSLHYTLLWGLEAVVLRTVGGPGDRVPNVNESRLRRRLEEAEMPVAAVDPGLFEGPAESQMSWLNDLAAFDETAAFCHRIGCDLVLIGALAAPNDDPLDTAQAGAALARVAKAAARARVRVAVRNSAGSRCASGEQLAAVLSAAREACDDESERSALGAAWSPADALAVGADPAAGLQALVEAGVPVLSVAVRDLAEGGAPAAVGEGRVGWTQQLERLAAVGFDGPLALEVGERPAGPAGVRAAAALIAMVRSAVAAEAARG